MSGWKLVWAKTRTVRGVQGAYEEVTAWKNADQAWAKEFLEKSDLIIGLMRQVSTPRIFIDCKTDPPDTLDADARRREPLGRPGSDPPKDQG